MFAKEPPLGHQQDHKILQQSSWKEFHKLSNESSRECIAAKPNAHAHVTAYSPRSNVAMTSSSR